MDLFFEIYVQLMLSVVAVPLFSLIFWFFWSHWKILSLAWKMPTLFPAFPIVGNSYVVARGTEWAFNYFMDSLKKYTISSSCPRSVFWIGSYPMFCVFDPDDIHIILQNKKSFEKGVELKVLRPLLGNGLLSSTGDEWRVTRPLINPMFHPRNLDLLYPTLNDCGRELVSDLAPHVGSGLCSVEQLVQPILLRASCKLIFGLESEVDVKSNKALKCLAAVTRGSEIVVERFFAWSTAVHSLLYDIELTFADNFIVEAFESSRNRNLANDTVAKCATGSRLRNEGDGDKSDIAVGRIQITLEDAYKSNQEIHPSFTDMDMIYQFRTLFAAGTETTRMTLSACILTLAAHTHIQEQLYTEIVAVTGAEDCDVTPGHIRAMPYLDQVVKETLRRFQIVPLFTRKINEDLKLRDWTIPAGSLVAVIPFVVHYNPKFYPDPDRFDPDRFSPENVAARGNHSFIPFGTGPHNCIGKVFAMMVMKTLLTHLLKKYRFSTSMDINSQKLCAALIPVFKDGYKVMVEAR